MTDCFQLFVVWVRDIWSSIVQFKCIIVCNLSSSYIPAENGSNNDDKAYFSINKEHTWIKSYYPIITHSYQLPILLTDIKSKIPITTYRYPVHPYTPIMVISVMACRSPRDRREGAALALCSRALAQVTLHRYAHAPIAHNKPSLTLTFKNVPYS